LEGDRGRQDEKKGERGGVRGAREIS